MKGNEDLIDRLKNAIAKNKLFVITGTGASSGVEKHTGGMIPSWGSLVINLKNEILSSKKEIESNKINLLERLTPDEYMKEVHGDSLIEASQILEDILGKSEFSEKVASETKEMEGRFSETQRIIAQLPIKGIITFNYDKCHESAFKENCVPYEVCLYSDAKKLKEYINSDFEKKALLLKAHGCRSNPESLILTSSSYANILNKEHVYRAFIQHVLSRFTILILGFGLRDRDFDQILNTLEKDFGAHIQDHIAIMREKDNEGEEKKAINKASYATLEARYGLKVLQVKEHDETPKILQELLDKEGSLIKNIVNSSINTSDKNFKTSRETIPSLSNIGKIQVRKLILIQLDTNLSLSTRAEALYVLGLLKDNDDSVVNCFVLECEKPYPSDTEFEGYCECIAHSLIGLRSLHIKDSNKIKRLEDKLLLDKFNKLDKELIQKKCNPRLTDYCNATIKEVIERRNFYMSIKKD